MTYITCSSFNSRFFTTLLSLIMSEYKSWYNVGLQYFCHACLKANDDVYPMTSEVINIYQNLILKEQQADIKTYYICIYCRHTLKKLAKFVLQCQKAADVLVQLLEKKPQTVLPLQTLASQTLEKTVTDINYIGPIELSIDNIKYEDNAYEDDFHTDEDVPLVLLSRNERGVIKNETSKKKRKKYGKLHLNENTLNQEERLVEKRYKNLKGKRQKTVREGFSSRMVQETEEYLVIKLTKEQVLEEMKERSKSDKYKRSLFKCEKCVKGFNFEDVLRVHMETHSRERGPLMCDICTQYCPTTVSLRGHIKSHTTRYQCKVCGAVRLSRQHLLEHHASHAGGVLPTYTCDFCTFATSKRTVIQRHVRSHAIRERHACEMCGKLFKNLESLRVHTLRHDTTKHFQCEQCSRKFIYQSLLNKHMKSVHMHEDFYCVECDVKFKSPENLRLHFRNAKRHRDASSFRHQCPQCAEKLATTSTLSVHLSTVHGAPKQHCCDLCTRRYSSREALRSHTRRFHGGDKKPQETCHICQKTFAYKSVLAKHLRTHTGERPYTCFCGAAFAQHATLRAHQLAKHKKQEDQDLQSSQITNET